MCFAKPGPRCANHCRVSLAKARAKFDVTREQFGSTLKDSAERAAHDAAEARLVAAETAYAATPEGAAKLRSEAEALGNANPERADALRFYAAAGEKAYRDKIRDKNLVDGAEQRHADMLASRVDVAVKRCVSTARAASSGDPEAKAANAQAYDEFERARLDLATTKEGQDKALRHAVVCREEADAYEAAGETGFAERQRKRAEAYERSAVVGRQTRLRQHAEYEAAQAVKRQQAENLVRARADAVAAAAPVAESAEMQQRADELRHEYHGLRASIEEVEMDNEDDYAAADKRTRTLRAKLRAVVDAASQDGIDLTPPPRKRAAVAVAG